MDIHLTKIERLLFDKPYWFNPKNNHHKKIHKSFLAIGRLFQSLLSDSIIEDSQIELIYTFFIVHIEDILEVTTSREHLEIAAYYSQLESDLLDECEEIEMFEACHNVKRFFDFYFNQINLTQND